MVGEEGRKRRGREVFDDLRVSGPAKTGRAVGDSALDERSQGLCCVVEGRGRAHGFAWGLCSGEGRGEDNETCPSTKNK